MKTIKHIITLSALILVSQINAQNFVDRLANETDGDFPAKWDLVGGSAEIATFQGDKIISLGNKAIIKPLMDSNNYLSDNFTLEFDVYFDDVEKSIKYQHYNIRFWDGNTTNKNFNNKSNVTTSPLKIYRYGARLEYTIRDPKIRKETHEELKPGLKSKEALWRFVAISYNNGALKVFIDGTQILNLPRAKFKPNMISIEGFYREYSKTFTRAIKNVKINGINQVIADNNNFDPIQNPTGEVINHTIGNSGSSPNTVPLSGGTQNGNENSEIVLIDDGNIATNPNNPNNTSIPTLSEEDIRSTEIGIDQDAAWDHYQKSEMLKRIEYGNKYNASGYSKLEVIDNNFITKNRSTITNSEKEEEGSNLCVTDNIVYDSNSESFSDFVLNSTPDWMLPGVFLRARDYIKGDYIVYNKERNPIDLLTNMPGSTSIKISNPHKNFNLSDAVNTILSNPNNVVAASISEDQKEIHSKEEFSFKLMGKYSNKIAQVTASLGLEFKETSHYYLYEMTQHMFSIDVSNLKKEDIFVSNDDINYNDLIYVSRVNYGRKAIVVIESKYDLKEIDANIEGQINTLVSKARLETSLSYLNEESNFTFKALLYGGSTLAGFRSLDLSKEQEKIELSNYLEKASDDARRAKPISYQIKNLSGQSMGVRSILNQTVRTCSPVINKNLKLKITLTDLLCIDEIDKGNNPDDYGLQQSVYYKADGHEIIASSTNYKKYIPKSENSNINFINENISYKKNLLAYGGENHQIHVEKSRVRVGNINNSITLNITPEQLNDPNAVFSIHTLLYEFTTNGAGVFRNRNNKLLYNSKIDIVIREVFTHLLNHSFETFTNPYYDSAITSRSDFYTYGSSGDVMSLAPGPSGSLEGPIRLGGNGQKAATWINFEIVD